MTAYSKVSLIGTLHEKLGERSLMIWSIEM